MIVLLMTHVSRWCEACTAAKVAKDNNDAWLRTEVLSLSLFFYSAFSFLFIHHSFLEILHFSSSIAFLCAFGKLHPIPCIWWCRSRISNLCCWAPSFIMIHSFSFFLVSLFHFPDFEFWWGWCRFLSSFSALLLLTSVSMMDICYAFFNF